MPGGRPRLPEELKRKPAAFKFKPEVLERLRALAAEEDRPMVAILTDALELYERRARRGKGAAA